MSITFSFSTTTAPALSLWINYGSDNKLISGSAFITSVSANPYIIYSYSGSVLTITGLGAF